MMKRASFFLIALLVMLSSVAIVPVMAAEEADVAITVVRSEDTKDGYIAYDVFIESGNLAYLSFSVQSEDLALAEVKPTDVFGYMGGNSHIFYASRDIVCNNTKLCSLLFKPLGTEHSNCNVELSDFESYNFNEQVLSVISTIIDENETTTEESDTTQETDPIETDVTSAPSTENDLEHEEPTTEQDVHEISTSSPKDDSSSNTTPKQSSSNVDNSSKEHNSTPYKNQTTLLYVASGICCIAALAGVISLLVIVKAKK